MKPSMYYRIRNFVLVKEGQIVNEVVVGRGLGFGIASTISSVVGHKRKFKKDSLSSCGCKLVEELLTQDDFAEQFIENMWPAAFGGIGATVPAKEDAGLHAYVKEAQRLTSSQRNVRLATAAAEVDGRTVQPGYVVVMFLGKAGGNPKEVANPDKFDVNRRLDPISASSYDQHECPAKGIATTFIVDLVT
ncbi:hypothetical protein LZ30DRAFT_784666 [Colletotrichum cereale]|nr:hypothetical protein LZ30DRAFT_784666 [Colletotrichum cereale]